MDVHFAPPATAPPAIANGNNSSSLSFHNLDWEGDDSDSVRDPTLPLQVQRNHLGHCADAFIVLCYVDSVVKRTAYITLFGFLSFYILLKTGNQNVKWFISIIPLTLNT